MFAWFFGFVAHAGPPLPAGAAAPSPARADLPVQVVLFVAPWDPVSRAVAADLAEEDGLPVVAVVERGPGVPLGSWPDDADLQVVDDADRAARRAWFGNDTDAERVPFAFVLAPGSDGAPVVQWSGAAVDPEAEPPDAELRRAIAGVSEGTWDLDAAIAAERAAAAAGERADALRQAFADGRLDRVRELVREVRRDGIEDPRLVAALNQVAWRMVSATDAHPAQVKVGLEAARLAVARGGADDPAVVDTWARALWERGRRRKALKVQAGAVVLADGAPSRSTFVETHDRYARELGAPEIGPPEAPWSGTINDAWDVSAELGEIVVGPAPSARDDAWARELAFLSEKVFDGAEIHAPFAVTDEVLGRHVAVLYGTPENNPLVARVLSEHGVQLAEDGVIVGGRKLPAEHPLLIGAFAAPWAPSRPVVVYTALRDEDALRLNSVFHGPTSLVVGRRAEKRPAALFSLNLRGASPVQLDAGPGTLTGAQAAEDLEALGARLRDGYAGYDDLEAAIGGSWAARTAAFAERLRSAGTISWDALFDVILEYLAPVSDTHFTVHGAVADETGARTRKARLVTGYAPYFADGRFAAGEVDGVEVVPGPDRAEPYRVYLFPTLPEGGEPRYLLGVLAASEPTPIDVTVAGEARTLPLHRGRTRLSRRPARAWSLQRPPDTPVPVVSVRNMLHAELAGLEQTPDEVRGAERVVLDLRSNYGGGDGPAHDWVRGLTAAPFRIGCSGQRLASAVDDPRRRWTSWLEPTLEGGEEAAWSGELFVLIDKGVASSGETFAFVASQVPGAVLVGENTSGCTSYGNIGAQSPLPHSGIVATFGETRFVWECVRPVREGMGVFPDLWLDDADPVTLLAGAEPMPGSVLK